MNLIPPFHSHSEALMSNLASRSHEWHQWELKELLYEIPSLARSRGVRRPHFRIVLQVNWRQDGKCYYVLCRKSSPTLTLLARKKSSKKVLESARILAMKKKDSQGNYQSQYPDRIDQQYG